MILADKEIKERIIQDYEEAQKAVELWKKGEWEKIKNKIVIHPFQAHALGPCCYDLSVGEEYVSLRDPHNPQELSGGKHILIHPSEIVLILSREYICLPKDVLAMIVPRATLIFEGVSLSATRIDPSWYGKLLIGFTNLAKNPVALDYGEEFCTCYFMQTTNTEKVLTRETVKSLGRENIGSIKSAHMKEQKNILPDRVTRDEIEKVVDLYGWPWDVVLGMFELTKKEIGNWIEKELTSDIVAEATIAAERRAFDELTTQYRDITRWNRILVISIISIAATVGAAIIGAIATYIIKQFT